MSSINIHGIPNAPGDYDLTGKKVMVHDPVAPLNTSTVLVDATDMQGAGSGGGSGSVTSVGATINGNAVEISNSPITDDGNLDFEFAGTEDQYVKGNGDLGTFSDDVQEIIDTNFPVLTQDGLKSGGDVVWTGTGLVFDVTPANYVIDGAPYTSPETQITLDTADATFGRYDVFAVNASGAVVKITGTPAASPVIPQIDPANEIYLTAVFVGAGATTPTQISNEVVYDENTEWSHSTSGTVVANFASTLNPHTGTKSILTTWSAPSNLIFTNGSTLVSSNYTTLSFYMRLTNAMANNTNVSVQIFNGSSPVTNQVAAVFSKSTTGVYQLVSFNISQFNFTSSQFNSVRIILTGSTSSVAVNFDLIRLQAGVTPPTTTQNFYARITDGSTTAAALGADVIKFRSADNKLSVAVGSNDATHGDNVLLTVNQANLTLSESQITNLTTDLAAKQATLVSGTNIKTVNGSSLLGSGDLVVSGGDVNVLKNYVTQSTSTGGGTTDNITIVNIPANTLGANGDGIEIEFAFTTTGVDTKSVALNIGSSSTLIASSAATTAAFYSHKVKLYRTSSTGAIYRAEGLRDNNQFAIAQALNTSFDWTTSQDLKISITSTTAASITVNYVTVKVVKE
jgi:hypothetical protein